MILLTIDHQNKKPVFYSLSNHNSNNKLNLYSPKIVKISQSAPHYAYLKTQNTTCMRIKNGIKCGNINCQEKVLLPLTIKEHYRKVNLGHVVNRETIKPLPTWSFEQLAIKEPGNTAGKISTWPC